jgi:hypothetical protein
MKKLFVLLIGGILLFACKEEKKQENILDKYNLFWNKPCASSAGSMPLGNGDISVNAWVEESGDLIFYLGKSDAWSENGRLLKVGKVRISFSPNLVAPEIPYRQELQFRQGQWVVEMGNDGDKRIITMWVDANYPVVHVDIEGKRKFEVEVLLELWRTKRREAREEELPSFYSIRHSNNPILIEADSVLSDKNDQLMWIHRNKRSVYKETMELQGLESLMEQDPLLYRTFGGLIKAEGLVTKTETTLETSEKTNQLQISVYLQTAENATTEEWKNQIEAIAKRAEALDIKLTKEKHHEWWNKFWNTSWVRVSGGDSIETGNITLGWHAHRYLMACAGRGKYPIKFNGSVFTVDGQPGMLAGSSEPSHSWDADYRNWGDPFWFQNQRQIYWPMLAAGDFELMKPFFKMYFDVLPLAKERTKIYYGHAGAFFPETMLFWGPYANSNYGYDRTNKPLGLTDNNYVKRHWQGGLELSTMMLEYYKHTGDKAFLHDTALPLISEVIAFYAYHWPLGDDGKIEMYPAQALETYWDVKNPLPEIAGMKKVLTELTNLPHEFITPEQREEWKKVITLVPDLPIKTDKDGNRYLAVAGENYSKSSNHENVALYSVFPYRLFGLGMDSLEMIRNSFHKKDFKSVYRCWHNDPVYAAYLGIPREAREQLGSRFVFSGQYRFPAFYIQGDWVPDHDNGGVAQQTVQAMLIQPVDDRILLFPAWPKEWDVDFKLHAPGNTIVEAEIRNGELQKFKVTPENRLKDISFLSGIRLNQ